MVIVVVKNFGGSAESNNVQVLFWREATSTDSYVRPFDKLAPAEQLV